MAPSDIANTWANIRQGVKEAELLIGEKKYNLSMVKSRQVLELMVNYLCDNASVSEEDLASSIDELYNSEWISKTTSEHYHKIRMLGNKAVHEGNNNGYDANQAYHLLSQEVYTFANEYKSKSGRAGGRGSGAQRSASRSSGSGSSGGRSSSGRPSGGRGTGARSSSGRDSQGRGPGSRNSGARGGSSRGSSSRGSRSRRRQSSGGFSPTPTDFIRLGLVLLVVVIIVLLVRLLMPKTEEDATDETSTTAPVETSYSVPETTMETTPVETETMTPTTPAPVYKTTSSLNVRSEPSTAGDILGLLEPGTIIDYVEDYDDEWTIINFNGVEAYVSSQYLAND